MAFYYIYTSPFANDEIMLKNKIVERKIPTTKKET